MAKQSLINRNEQRKATVKKFAAKRKALQDAANDQSLAPEERYDGHPEEERQDRRGG